ncbi:glycosyltransferase family 4 protein [Solibacillus sp. MA9]|uniref:Glycosyltransferase family 4 protein n=1 Tax=Solibacillus palustris TaxID=2908203 RepID=A0ABS9U9J8_9BACL|nr:glycosyltransferase family 4 protein [Solibacillus sp. MA9]MCH7321020.1 glycosyltransferase family 4 protein [Solibacillus sp. MA9]
MKLLVICQYYNPEPFRISDICESLVEKGHQVTVLTGLPNYPEGKVLDNYRYGKNRKEVINGVNVIRSFEIGRGNSKVTLLLNYFSFALSASLKALFMKEKFDAVFVNQLSPVFMGVPAIVYKKKHKKKMLLYCLDIWPASLTAGGIKEGSIIYKFFHYISKWIYNSADNVAVSSGMFIDYLRETIGVKTESILHLPQYAEKLFTEKKEVDRSKHFNFVFAGNIGEMQSVQTIVKAAYELRNHTNIRFHIVGDGSKLAENKLLSKNLGLQNIIFHGRKPLSEMPKYYSLADAMLITLKNDNTISSTLPGKVQSYMASGKPIIGAINGETNQIIKEAQCGLCCEAEKYNELANIIVQFCENSEKDQMAINSYDYYCKNYSKERFLNVLEDTLIKMEA